MVAAQDATWHTVQVPGLCTFQIPPSLEIQKGVYKTVNDQFRRTVLQITDSPNRVVAQPVGINDLDPRAMDRYCRVIVETQMARKGEFDPLGKPILLTKTELQELDKIFRTQQDAAQKELAKKGATMQILSWVPVAVADLNGTPAISYGYCRSGHAGAPAVWGRTYAVQNNDCMHTITVSCRDTEKNLWADDLRKVLQTFRFVKR